MAIFESFMSYLCEAVGDPVGKKYKSPVLDTIVVWRWFEFLLWPLPEIDQQLLLVRLCENSVTVQMRTIDPAF